MALSLQSIADAPIIELDAIDSTNNYAMQLIDADTAQQGLTVLAQRQDAGKGQRGRIWLDEPGKSVLMSLITAPRHRIEEQFLYNATVIVSVADVLQRLDEGWDVRIKWPNDIIVNDKKAGGILIENVLRGTAWAYGVIGLGLNVLQHKLDDSLVYATSLLLASGKRYVVKDIALELRYEILKNLYDLAEPQHIMGKYNDYLFRKGAMQQFFKDEREWEATVVAVSEAGQLIVQTHDGRIERYTHGVVNWKW